MSQDDKIDHYRDTLIDIIEQELRAMAPTFGVHQGVVGDFAQALSERLGFRCGGTQVWITGVNRKRRDTEIRERFRGNNLQELAMEYRLTPRHIRNILGAQRVKSNT